MLVNAIATYLLLGWMVFCGTVYSYALHSDANLRDVAKYLVFSLLVWPYTIFKMSQK